MIRSTSGVKYKTIHFISNNHLFCRQHPEAQEITKSLWTFTCMTMVQCTKLWRESWWSQKVYELLLVWRWCSVPNFEEKVDVFFNNIFQSTNSTLFHKMIMQKFFQAYRQTTIRLCFHEITLECDTMFFYAVKVKSKFFYVRDLRPWQKRHIFFYFSKTVYEISKSFKFHFY
jgi:hypothetical protein